MEVVACFETRPGVTFNHLGAAQLEALAEVQPYACHATPHYTTQCQAAPHHSIPQLNALLARKPLDEACLAGIRAETPDELDRLLLRHLRGNDWSVHGGLPFRSSPCAAESSPVHRSFHQFCLLCAPPLRCSAAVETLRAFSQWWIDYRMDSFTAQDELAEHHTARAVGSVGAG